MTYRPAYEIVADAIDAARAAGFEFEVRRVDGDVWVGRFYSCAKTGGVDTVGVDYPTVSCATGNGKGEAAANALANFIENGPDEDADRAEFPRGEFPIN